MLKQLPEIEAQLDHRYGRRRIDTGEKWRCKRCPLNNEQPCVRGAGAKDALVCFVGERPGSVECRVGRPFVGPAGEMLDRVLDDVGQRGIPHFRTNVVRCYAPGNKPPRAGEIDACGTKLALEFKKLKNLKMVIALGAVPAKALLRTTKGVTWLRGRVMDFPAFPVLFGATYHPAAVLRNPDLYSDLRHDLGRYISVVLGEAKPEKVPLNYYWADTEETALEVLSEVNREKRLTPLS